VSKLFIEIHFTTTECHLPYGITQCYLPPDTSEHTPPLPQPDRLVLIVTSPSSVTIPSAAMHWHQCYRWNQTPI